MTKVLETYTSDGIDIIHEWSSVEEALESGRFDYLFEEEWYDDDDRTEDTEFYTNLDSDFNSFVRANELYMCKSVKELIEKISYPFEIIEE